MRDRVNEQTNETEKTGDFFFCTMIQVLLNKLNTKDFLSFAVRVLYIYIYIAEYLGVINN